MANTDSYQIEWDDGTVRYRLLDSDDAKAWKERADDKNSTVKSVKKGTPDPINKGS